MCGIIGHKTKRSKYCLRNPINPNYEPESTEASLESISDNHSICEVISKKIDADQNISQNRNLDLNNISINSSHELNIFDEDSIATTKTSVGNTSVERKNDKNYENDDMNWVFDDVESDEYIQYVLEHMDEFEI